MASETEQILRWFYREYLPSGVLDFDDLLLQAAKAALAQSQMDLEAYVYRNRKRLWNDMLRKFEIDKRLGRSRLFSILDGESRRLYWLPSNSDLATSTREKMTAIKLRARPYIMQMIEQLSDRQYEALGCVVSELAGATDVQLTPRGNEGGVDFFATVNSPARCHVFHGNYKPLQIVGQCKKYGAKVQVDRVKEFIETLDEVKNQNPIVEHLVPPWFRIACGPVVGWLIAHNSAQSGALTKAQNHGIIISDSVDLAEIAALSRRIDPTLPASGRARELEIRVIDLLGCV